MKIQNQVLYATFFAQTMEVKYRRRSIYQKRRVSVISIFVNKFSQITFHILNMKQSILEAIDYVRNVSKKRLSNANILSRISKTGATNLDTRSLEKELHQMIAKGWIDSSYKIVNNMNLKFNVETTSKDTLSNNDVE